LTFLGYVWLRQLAYPIKLLSTGTMSFSFDIKFLICKSFALCLNLCKSIYYSFLTLFVSYRFYFFCERYHIVWIYKLLKNSLLFICFASFLTNSKKKEMIFLFFCFFVLLWPLFLGGSGLRYFYEALPFGVLCVAILFYFSSLTNYRYIKLTAMSLAVVFLVSHASVIIHKQYLTSKEWETFNLGLQAFKRSENNRLNGKNDMFLFNLNRVVGYQPVGIVEAFELYGINPKVCKFLFRYLEVFPQTTNIDKFLQIKQFKSSIRFFTKDKKKLWFEFNDNFSSDLKCYIENIVIYEKEEPNKIFDLTLVLKKELFNSDLLFITWDDVNKKFLILEK